MLKIATIPSTVTISLPSLVYLLSCHNTKLYGVGNTNTSNAGGGKQSLSVSDTRIFKRVNQSSTTTTNTPLSSATVVSVKQEGTIDNLMPSYVDSTTFVNSPAVQQNNVRQQPAGQTQLQRSPPMSDYEQVTITSKL